MTLTRPGTDASDSTVAPLSPGDRVADNPVDPSAPPSATSKIFAHPLNAWYVAAWDHVMAVNLRAPFLLAQAVVPHMREQRYGRIVLLSSVAAFLGGILSPQYTASKAGLIGLAHSLAATLAPHGITVNAIAPGLIMTDMLAGDPRLETLERSVPVGRLGQPAEVADVIVAVARNAYMTGQTVSVDGGRYPR